MWGRPCSLLLNCEVENALGLLEAHIRDFGLRLGCGKRPVGIAYLLLEREQRLHKRELRGVELGVRPRCLIAPLSAEVEGFAKVDNRVGIRAVQRRGCACSLNSRTA